MYKEHDGRGKHENIRWAPRGQLLILVNSWEIQVWKKFTHCQNRFTQAVFQFTHSLLKRSGHDQTQRYYHWFRLSSKRSSLQMFSNSICPKTFRTGALSLIQVCTKYDIGLHIKVYTKFTLKFAHGLPQVWAKFTSLFRKYKPNLQFLCMMSAAFY